MDPKIILLVRNFNRPEYLENTLKSLLLSDIDKCHQRYIYDDGSNDPMVNEILNNDSYINHENKQFAVIRNEQNVGCRKSFTDALNYIKQNNNDFDFILTLDNDVVVKPDLVSVMLSEYMKASDKFNTNNILFTGFNCKNAHLTMIENNDTYYTKSTCGAVNWFFHKTLFDFIIENWNINLDWGVNHAMNSQNWPMCCVTKSVVNHVGYFGLNSNGNCDIDTDFDK